MKYALAAAIILLSSTTVVAQEMSELSTPPNGDNEHATVSQWIGPVKISIDYHSPKVHNPDDNDRTGHIWGELVHYGFADEGFGPTKGAPWRAGANESTSITFSNDVKVEGKDLKAGTYALFLDVEKTGPWNWVFSNHLGWGSFQYDPQDDALRVPVTPEDAPFTEFLTYGFDDRRPDSAVAYLQWEKKRIPFKIEVPECKQALCSEDAPGPPVMGRVQLPGLAKCGAILCRQQDQFGGSVTVGRQGDRWAVPGGHHCPRRFFHAFHKSGGVGSDGTRIGRRCLDSEGTALPGADAYSVYAYGMGLLRRDKKDRAMKIFVFNQQHHPQDKFWTSLGLARGYTAVGDKKNAIANWEVVLRNVPSNLSNRTAAYEASLKKLKGTS